MTYYLRGMVNCVHTLNMHPLRGESSPWRVARDVTAQSSCKVFFSEGGELIKLHIEGSLTIPAPGIKRVGLWNIPQALGADRADGRGTVAWWMVARAVVDSATTALDVRRTSLF